MGIDIETIFDISEEQLKENKTNNDDYEEVIGEINELELKIKELKKEKNKTLLQTAIILTVGTALANTIGVELNMMEHPENYLLAGTFLIGGLLISDAAQSYRIINYHLKQKIEELYEELKDEEINRKGIKKLSRTR